MLYEPKTQVEYDRMCGVLADKVECDDVAELRPVHFADFIAEWFSDKPNAARKYKQLASRIMQHAIRKDFRQDDPAAKVDLSIYPEDDGRSRYLTDDELRRIRNGALGGKDADSKGGMGSRKTRNGEMTVCMIDLALITGQRIGDILTCTTMAFCSSRARSRSRPASACR